MKIKIFLLPFLLSSALGALGGEERLQPVMCAEGYSTYLFRTKDLAESNWEFFRLSPKQYDESLWIENGLFLRACTRNNRRSSVNPSYYACGADGGPAAPRTAALMRYTVHRGVSTNKTVVVPKVPTSIRAIHYDRRPKCRPVIEKGVVSKLKRGDSFDAEQSSSRSDPPS